MKITVEFNLEHREGPQLPAADRDRLIGEVIEEAVGNDVWVDDTRYAVVDSIVKEVP